MRLRFTLLLMLFMGVLISPLKAAERPIDQRKDAIDFEKTTQVVLTEDAKKSTKDYRPPKIEGNAAAALILSFLSIIFLSIYVPLGILSMLVAIVCIIRSRIKIKKETKERWRGKKFTTFAIILIAILMGLLGALLGSGELQQFF